MRQNGPRHQVCKTRFVHRVCVAGGTTETENQTLCLLGARSESCVHGLSWKNYFQESGISPAWTLCSFLNVCSNWICKSATAEGPTQVPLGAGLVGSHGWFSDRV